MKKLCFALFLTFALTLCACGESPADDGSVSGEPASLSAGLPAAEPSPASQPDTRADMCDTDAHESGAESNIIPHESAGYCGNTMTSIRRAGSGEAAGFDGDDSVALTDLLRYLDYADDICRCVPEYTVDTEFGTGYGVNLTERYVRYDGRQVPLTEEQTELVRGIIDRHAQ